MKTYKIESSDDFEGLSLAGKIVKKDGILAYPTDTIYGLGCNPWSEKAVKKIYRIKNRDGKEPLIILIDSASRLSEWCHVIPGRALPLIMRWPASLTIILKVKFGLPEHISRGGDSLAFRVPDSKICREIVTSCGGSLTSTSINRSGQKPLNSPEEIKSSFGRKIDLLIDAPTFDCKSSTVIRCVDNQFKVLRSGSFPLKTIQTLLNNFDDEMQE